MRCNLLISVGLVFLTAVTFWRVRNAEFVEYDDPVYVFQNPHVLNGLTWDGLLWAATSVGYESNWHPLTWLSHMLDVSLFGKNPSGHHLVNLGFHVCNAVLLFLLWRWMTGAVWPGALVAVLFALHPMHVESVAWVSERKDVLSTMFGLLTIFAYVRYTRRPRFNRYALVALLFALCLMAKPMLVTLPFILMLLDYWPLRRNGTAKEATAESRRNKRHLKAGPGASIGETLKRSFLEKLPLFVLSALSSAVTMIAQSRGGATLSLIQVPLGRRFENAIVSYCKYLLALVWPLDLAVFYPLKMSFPFAQVVVSVVILFAATVVAVILARSGRPYAIVGWLWFLGTLVPVIGLVQVGNQAMADRYSYFSYVGLFVAIAWGASELWDRSRVSRPILTAAAAASVAACMALAMSQIDYWQDTESLFWHWAAVSPDNAHSQNIFGKYTWERGNKDLEAAGRLELEGKKDDARALSSKADQERRVAVEHWREAIRIRPDFADGHNNLGFALQTMGQEVEAERHFRAAIEYSPGLAVARINLGALLLSQGKVEEAAQQFESALQSQPGNALAHRAMALTRLQQGKLEEAAIHFEELLRLKPDDVSAINDLGQIRARQGRMDEAVALFRRALSISPGFVPARSNLDSLIELRQKK